MSDLWYGSTCVMRVYRTDAGPIRYTDPFATTCVAPASRFVLDLTLGLVDDRISARCCAQKAKRAIAADDPSTPKARLSSRSRLLAVDGATPSWRARAAGE